MTHPKPLAKLSRSTFGARQALISEITAFIVGRFSNGNRVFQIAVRIISQNLALAFYRFTYKPLLAICRIENA